MNSDKNTGNMGSGSSDDQVREALTIMGLVRSGEPLTSTEWADVAMWIGFGKRLFNAAESDTEAGRARAMGVILSNHDGETFVGAKNTTLFRFELEQRKARWGKVYPHTRYTFRVLEEGLLPEDDAEI